MMDIQKENNLIQEAFEVEADEIGFCLYQKWGDYENPYENSDTALAFNLFKKGWQAAKAHEAEKLKGKVVVPVEPTPKMIDSTWDDQDEIETMSHNSRNEFIYKKMIRVAMVEAARGGNDE